MESSAARSRQLVCIALAALRVLEVRDFEQRLLGLEQSVNPNNNQLALPMFDVEQELLKPDDKEGEHDSK